MLKEFLKLAAGLTSLLLIVILSACTSGTVSAQSFHVHAVEDTSVAPFTQSLDAAPGSMQNQNSSTLICPGVVRTNGYWNKLLHTQHGINAVESVTCASMKGDGTPQALVLVRNDGTGHILNLYVYDGLGNAAPQQIFTVEALYKGSARISPYNTIITGEADTLSAGNRNKPNIGILPDVYREFKWSAYNHAFVQTIFPGLFPDLTRFQAEADQEQVNQGHQPWKLDAVQTAQALINGISGPSTAGQPVASIISGGGKHDVGAVVKVKSTHPGSSWVHVNMTRLEGNTNNIWIVIKVQTDGLSIDTPAALTQLSSPVKVIGQGVAFEDVIGDLIVQNRLDPGIGVIGQVSVRGKQGLGHTTFSSTISYTSSAKASGIAAEEGTLALYSISLADGSVSGMCIIKVLLSS